MSSNMDRLPTEIHIKVMEYLDLKSRYQLVVAYPFLEPCLYDKSLIRVLKIEQDCVVKDFEHFWKKFPKPYKMYIKTLDISSIRFTYTSTTALNFFLSLSSLKELRMLFTNISNMKQRKLLMNNENLETLRISAIKILWFGVLHNLKTLRNLFLFSDNTQQYFSIQILFMCISPSIQFIWIEYNDFIGSINYGNDVFHIMRRSCPKLQELFMVFRGKTNKTVLGPLRPLNVFYRVDDNRYFLFKEENKKSEIIKKLNLYPTAYNCCNISHDPAIHVNPRSVDLSSVNFEQIRGFSSNVCRYYEPFNLKRTAEGMLKNTKFEKLIASLKKCETFELVGCNRRGSIYDRQLFIWNEEILRNLSSLKYLTSLTLYNVKFTDINFLQKVAKICPLRTLKLTVVNAHPSLFFKIAMIVRNMPYLKNFRYEDRKVILPNLQSSLIPIRFSTSLERYSLTISSIQEYSPLPQTFNDLPIYKGVKLLSIRVEKFQTRGQLKKINSYLKNCSANINPDFKFIVGSSTNLVTDALKSLKTPLTIEDYNEVLTTCTSIVNFDHTPGNC